MKICFILYLSFVTTSISKEDYQYDEYAELLQSNEGGDRLVGASRANIGKLSFLVGFNVQYRGYDSSACTGSLITSSWVVSAAHCILSLVPTNKIRKCVSRSEKKGFYHNKLLQTNVKCSYLRQENLKIELLESPGIAYIGVADITKSQEIVNGEKIEIDFVVRHAQTYRGGGNYGDFGGYDITLIHLSKPVPGRYQPACLPGPAYQDTGIGPAYPGGEQANLAGFGKFRRTPCLTDRFGPSKFHYCSHGSDCLDTEAPRDPTCDRFFRDPTTPDNLPDSDEELFIVEKNVFHKCYRRASKDPSSLGWCTVSEDASQIGELNQKVSWGFCSKDCYLEEEKSEPSSSVLRKRLNIDILDEKLCDLFLQKSLYTTVEVRPHILCIGRVESLNYTVWHYENGLYRKGHPNDVKHPLDNGTGLGKYIRSSGTCNGDSGGPVFTYDDDYKKFVVLGTVSGGRGYLGNCGGLNNPTHYARVKMFGKWIKMILGEESHDLCFI